MRHRLNLQKVLVVVIIYRLYLGLLFETAVRNPCAKMHKVSDKLHHLSVKNAKSHKYDTLRVYLVTWNVGAAGPPKDLTELLDLKEEKLPDIYGIGFQELDPTDKDMKDNQWTCRLTDDLGRLDYVRIKVVRMQAISLQVFVKRSLLLHVTSIESEYSKAGMGGWWGNKGGVSIRFDVGGVNVIIVNTHLAAHLEEMAERIEDYNVVLSTQKFRDRDVENILDHDYVFWMGDLNCRLENISKDAAIKLIEKNELDKLLKLDQLKQAQQEGLMLVDFHEGPINFKPTYKFDKDTDIYDTSEKQRIPAWCDRILYKTHDDIDGLKMSKRKYYSPAYNKGDHKPVAASFEINVFDMEPNPFVIFDPINKWGYGKTQTFHYTIRCGIEPDSSPWDFIGLYKADFKTFDDYKTWVYGKNNAEDRGDKGVTLEIKGSYLKEPPGKYVLCYISKYKGWLRGMSNVFEIVG
ncbi:inositol polyphosphate 5-phosphatase K-like isoform X2 [Ruditapes philippinarum]|uniref:inositol polyphosphate 5-phosphatase K-like isoform X2 n=1 Tax=Ruditapes philippinarum TaxID=129788 RepID=UPI00295B297E|nr:inositol polyphosphate 5-phosphatase K-like isoform X2 [Ruditapes philippinarum]